MENRSSVAGRWSGRLIDIQGFEGEVSLELKGGDDLEGRFQVSIGGQHDSMRREGKVSGSLSDGHLRLALDAGNGVRIAFEGSVFSLRQQGKGLKGTYRVASERGASPLQGGTLVASQGAYVPSQEVHQAEGEVRVAAASGARTKRGGAA